jgi:hypothetical protein
LFSQRKGLLQTCGNADWKAVTTLQLKASAEMALQLVAKLLLDAEYNPDNARCVLMGASR